MIKASPSMARGFTLRRSTRCVNLILFILPSIRDGGRMR